MRAVDTNVLVRLFVRDDPKQAEAAEDYIKSGAWVSHIALVETIWVLDSVYEKTRFEIFKMLEGLLDHKSLIIQDEAVVAEALKTFRESRGVDFSDCMMLAVARKNGHTPLGTFDTKLGRIAGAQKIS